MKKIKLISLSLIISEIKKQKQKQNVTTVPSNPIARHQEYLFISPPEKIRVDGTFKLHTHLINECEESDSGCI